MRKSKIAAAIGAAVIARFVWGLGAGYGAVGLALNQKILTLAVALVLDFMAPVYFILYKTANANCGHKVSGKIPLLRRMNSHCIVFMTACSGPGAPGFFHPGNVMLRRQVIAATAHGKHRWNFSPTNFSSLIGLYLYAMMVRQVVGDCGRGNFSGVDKA